MSDRISSHDVIEEKVTHSFTEEQVVEVWTNVAPSHPALKRVHQKLNTSVGAEAAITSYDRMHHRHNRS